MARKLNKPWNELTKAEKRVRIAKDALAQIRTKKVEVQSGTYCDIFSNKLKEGSQLNKILPTLEADSCTVCAKGALFLAHVDRFNKLKIEDNGAFSANNSQIIDRLKGIFSIGQLDTIEAAFEMGVTQDAEHILWDHSTAVEETELAKRAIAFGEEYSDDLDRLVAILENIIENKGTFIP